MHYEHGADDVLVLGTDGLWDVLSNQEVAEAVTCFLANCDPDDQHRHVFTLCRPERPFSSGSFVTRRGLLSHCNHANFQTFTSLISLLSRKKHVQKLMSIVILLLFCFLLNFRSSCSTSSVLFFIFIVKVNNCSMNVP